MHEHVFEATRLGCKVDRDKAFREKLLRETLDSIGCPLLALEGDCMDASIDPCSTVTKISSFVEALNLSRYGNIFGKTTI